MREAKFEKDCIKDLRSLPFSYWPDKADALSVRGLPDRVGCINGLYIAIEFKKSLSEARKNTGRIVLQRKTLGDIMAARGMAFVVYPENWEKVFNEIKSIVALKGGH